MPLCSNFITDLAALQEHYYRTLFWLMWYWLTWSVWRVEELVLHKHKNTPSFDTYFSVCLWVCWEPPLKICSNSAEISHPVLHIVSRKETLICILWFSAKIMHRAVSLPLHLRTDICLKIYYRHWYTRALLIAVFGKNHCCLACCGFYFHVLSHHKQKHLLLWARIKSTWAES